MLELKRRGELRGVIVSGCLAARQREGLLIDRSVGVICALESQGYMANPANGNELMAGWTPAGVSMMLGVAMLLHLEDG